MYKTDLSELTRVLGNALDDIDPSEGLLVALGLAAVFMKRITDKGVDLTLSRGTTLVQRHLEAAFREALEVRKRYPSPSLDLFTKYGRMSNAPKIQSLFDRQRSDLSDTDN